VGGKEILTGNISLTIKGPFHFMNLFIKNKWLIYNNKKEKKNKSMVVNCLVKIIPCEKRPIAIRPTRKKNIKNF
jgi:hypothetical protein